MSEVVNPAGRQALWNMRLRPSARRQGVRLCCRLILALLTVACCGSLTIIWRIHSSNATEDHAIFLSQPAPRAHQRILVFSPHCDDETLGAGGFIHAAVAAGADVRVVMMTNGDGFGLAAALHYRQIRVTPQLLRTFAVARQQETLAADGSLGVPSGHVTFLGFPDQGLAELWRGKWTVEHPYFSQQTHCDHNPYPNSLHPGQAYCGSNLLEDVEEELNNFQPDLVLAPHPNDDHPDHWATSAFVRAALADLERQKRPWVSQTRCEMFVVHHGDWPVPQGYHPQERLAPPYSLNHTDTRWFQYGLSETDEIAKHNAIRQYHSQVAVMARFLESFVRKTECFGTIPVANLQLTQSGAGNHVVVETSPISDTLLRSFEASANIESIDAQQDGDEMCLRLMMRAHISPRVRYTISLHDICRGGGTLCRWHGSFAGGSVETDIPGATLSAQENYVQLRIPVSLMAHAENWFVSADTRMASVNVDRAGWRQFRILPALAQQPLARSAEAVKPV